jgi:NADH-quinone oxidoreductase subunit C
MTDGPTDRPALDEALAALAAHAGDGVLATAFAKGELTVRLRPDAVVAAVAFLKAARGFSALNDMIGLDNGPAPAEGRKRFSVFYQLYNREARLRIRLAAEVGEGEALPSIVGVHKAADWAEREIYDMFGIVFEGHPDLRRVYLDPGFEGHALRKDFPLKGRA